MSREGKSPWVILNAHYLMKLGTFVRASTAEGSDLDILVDPIKGKTTLISLGSIQLEIENLTGIKTDVLTPMALHERFRNEVLGEARPVWPTREGVCLTGFKTFGKPSRISGRILGVCQRRSFLVLAHQP